MVSLCCINILVQGYNIARYPYVVPSRISGHVIGVGDQGVNHGLVGVLRLYVHGIILVDYVRRQDWGRHHIYPPVPSGEQRVDIE